MDVVPEKIAELTVQLGEGIIRAADHRAEEALLIATVTLAWVMERTGFSIDNIGELVEVIRKYPGNASALEAAGLEAIPRSTELSH